MMDVLIWLVAALGAVGGVVLGRVWGRITGKRDGRKESERNALQDTKDRVAGGRSALREGRDAGDPAQRLHDNDDAW